MKQFETDVFLMTIHDDLLIEFKVKKNKNLQEKDIWESRDLSVNYMPNKKFMVLIETEENFEVSGDARRAGASLEYSKHLVALALYSTKLYETILGNLFIKINKPIVPTKFFDDRNKAVQWLKHSVK